MNHPCLALLLLSLCTLSAWAKQPNIILLLTDDQGYGDLGYTGNPDIKTPHIDAFARESVVFDYFYVSPVCTPTRASLMTGRYNQRTGAIDTWMGRSTMHQDEFTLAEALKDAGYATGLFGKWHLGDTYPYRAQDQGFDEVLMHLGGGIGQPSTPEGSNYFNPILWENGVEKQFNGYCMDVYTDATIAFIEQHKDRPFFAFLATNTPHTPLEVPERYSKPYMDAGLPEKTSIIYGMTTNIDDNFARVLEKLEQLNIAQDTIVIYMSDNGPKIFHPEQRFRAGQRGEKTGVYQGGIRSPFFFRWPAKYPGHRTLSTRAAHIDLMPTLLSAAGIDHDKHTFDGHDVLPLIEGEEVSWAERILYFQWHRGNEPEPYRNFTVLNERFKLVQNRNKFDTSQAADFELYDLINDPGETTNVAAQYPEVLEHLKASYDQWLIDVSQDRGYPEMPTWVGSDLENPVLLTHQDRRDSPRWGNDTFYPEANWPVKILKQGKYQARLTLFKSSPANGKVFLKLGETIFEGTIAKGSKEASVDMNVSENGVMNASAWVETGEKKRAPKFLRLKYLGIK